MVQRQVLHKLVLIKGIVVRQREHENLLDQRICNFSAGPAALPQDVLEQVRDELLNWQGQGASVMEVGHRTPEFLHTAREAEQDLRELLLVPDNYRVLFLQGGARGQFAAIPLNLKGDKSSADYVNSGFWAQTAIDEAGRYLKANVVVDGAAEAYRALPAADQWQLNRDAAYLHYTPNETIGGLEFSFIPESGEVPLVADMSSNILSAPLDVSRFGMIYAGAQKNIGPAGLTLVIIRDDLLDRGAPQCPSVLDYRQQNDHHSMYNTPPTFAWYLAGLVFKWLKKQGGLAAIGAANARKAATLYRQIDSSGFYLNNVESPWRSRMNVPFTLASPELEPLFLTESAGAGLCYLQGHRAVGGMRASLYNAVPERHVDALVDFMKDFERRYG